MNNSILQFISFKHFFSSEIQITNESLNYSILYNYDLFDKMYLKFKPEYLSKLKLS